MGPKLTKQQESKDLPAYSLPKDKIGETSALPMSCMRTLFVHTSMVYVAPSVRAYSSCRASSVYV